MLENGAEPSSVRALRWRLRSRGRLPRGRHVAVAWSFDDPSKPQQCEYLVGGLGLALKKLGVSLVLRELPNAFAEDLRVDESKLADPCDRNAERRQELEKAPGVDATRRQAVQLRDQ